MLHSRVSTSLFSNFYVNIWKKLLTTRTQIVVNGHINWYDFTSALIFLVNITAFRVKMCTFLWQPLCSDIWKNILNVIGFVHLIFFTDGKINISKVYFCCETQIACDVRHSQKSNSTLLKSSITAVFYQHQ